MNTGIACISRWLILIATLAMAAGCGDGRTPARAPAERGNALQMESPQIARAVLRVRRDVERNRLWVLSANDVRIYDATWKRLIRKVELPNWSVAAFVCNPDLGLDASGAAIVSSNVQSRLWRIDANSFTVIEREIRLHEREQWDTGFGALEFAADGALLASTCEVGGSLWRIDFGEGSARLVGTDTARARSRAFPAQFFAQLQEEQHP